MKKLVRTNLTNTPSRRGTKDLNIQFYSHDKNNAGFEFVIKNETDLTQYTPKVLFKFRDSNSTWQANGTIEGNIVKVSFNTDLIARREEVLGFLFLDSDSDSLDIFKFKFNVVLSEIDKDGAEKRRIKHVENIESLDVVTRTELKDMLAKLQISGGVATEGLLTEVKAEELYAKKTELPQPYNYSVLEGRVTALENRPTTGDGNVDTSKFVSNEMFDETLKEINGNFSLIHHPLYIGYIGQETAKEYLDGTPILGEKPSISYNAGVIFAKMIENNNYPQNPQIFKGDENNEKFVDFDATMYSLANSLPDNYNLNSVREDINNKAIFLSNKNFSEVVPRDELKAIIKEVLTELKSENN